MKDDLLDRGVAGGEATCREPRAPGKESVVGVARPDRPYILARRIGTLAIFAGQRVCVPILALNGAHEKQMPGIVFGQSDRPSLADEVDASAAGDDQGILHSADSHHAGRYAASGLGGGTGAS